jgi:hypothetical protein
MTISNCFKMSFMALKGEGEGIFAHYFIGMNLVQLRKAVRSFPAYRFHDPADILPRLSQARQHAGKPHRHCGA